MRKLLAAVAALSVLPTMSTMAAPIRLDGAETDLQQIIDNLTGGTSGIDVVTDQHQLDEGWAIDSSSGQAGALILLELAGYAGVNRFGLYDLYDPNTRVQLFDGAASTGSGTLFGINGSGQVFRDGVATGQTFGASLFGFYLETPAGLWYSHAARNSDQADHLVAYSLGASPVLGSDVFLFGWEDLSSRNWDQDYNDFVVFVGGVKGVDVPEPATLGLLGLGLAGIGLARRRKLRQ